MRRFLQYLGILTLLIWGGILIYFYASGRIAAYLDQSFRTWALLAGLGLMVVGIFNLATMKRATAASCCAHDDHDHDHVHDHDHDHDHAEGACCDHDHDHAHVHHDHDHDHDHDHESSTLGMVVGLFILLVPLCAAAAVTNDRFSSGYVEKWDTINRQIKTIHANQVAASKGDPAAPATPSAATEVANEALPGADGGAGAEGTEPGNGATAESGSGGEQWSEYTLDDLKRQVPQTDEGNFLLEVPQLYYTGADPELQRVLEGLGVETTAQVMKEKLNNPEGKRLRLFRLFIECCAADARPLSIPIEFEGKAPELPDMGWVRVIGKMTYVKENNEIVPLLKVETLEEVPEPAESMMF